MEEIGEVSCRLNRKPAIQFRNCEFELLIISPFSQLRIWIAGHLAVFATANLDCWPSRRFRNCEFGLLAINPKSRERFSIEGL
jgi:hypothetical protein